MYYIVNEKNNYSKIRRAVFGKFSECFQVNYMFSPGVHTRLMAHIPDYYRVANKYN